MAVTATFQADFSTFQDAVAKAGVQLRGFEANTASVEKSLTRMVDNFSGRKLIEEATKVASVIERMGGTSRFTEAELQRLAAQANEAAAKLRAMGQEVPAGIQKIADSARASTSAFDGMKSIVLSLAGAFGITFSIGALVQFTRALFDQADALVKMADRTGISVQGLQRLQIASDDTSVSMETITQAVNQMQKRLAGGDASALGALKELKLSFQDLKTLDPDQQFMALADAIRQVRDPAEQTRLSIALFGKSGAENLPVIKRGFDDIRDAAIGMGPATVKTLDETGDAIGRLWRRFKGEASTATAVVIDSLKEVYFLGKTVQQTFDDMFAQAAKKRPNLAAGGVPDIGLSELEIEHVTRRLEEQRQELAKHREEAKRQADALAKVTAEAHKMEAALFAIPEGLDKIGRHFDEAKLGPMADAILKVEQAAHIANFGFKGMGDNLESVGEKVPLVNEELRKLADGIYDMGPKFDYLKAKAESLGGQLLTVFQSIPQTIANAFTGGGGLGGALKSIGTQLASTIGNSVGKGIAALGSLGGPIGSAIGSLAGPLISLFGKLFGNPEKQINPIREAFVQAAGGLGALNQRAHEAGVTLDHLLNAKNPEAYKKAIDELTAAFDFQDQSMATLDETVKRYGFTIEELGPALQRQELDKQAQQIFKDWQVLNSAGIDTTVIAGKMADSINEYVKRAVGMGIEVPASMRPMLQRMIDMGLLTDASGNKIADFETSGISFAETMTEGFTRVVDSVTKLADAISKTLGGAINSIPTERTIHIGYQYDPINLPDNGMATGGLVTAHGIQHFAGGGNVLPFVPRGTDRVPAMLTPGEMVLTKGQQQRLFSGGGRMNTAAIEDKLDRNHRQALEEARRQPERTAIAVRDAIVLAGLGRRRS